MKLRGTEKIWLLIAALCLTAAVAVTAAYRTPASAAAVAFAPLAVSAAPSASAGETVDLNTATAEQLDTLPGIGPKLAARIVAYRNENGPFKTAEDVMKVAGIGAGKFEKFKDRIAVTQEGTT